MRFHVRMITILYIIQRSKLISSESTVSAKVNVTFNEFLSDVNIDLM
jgi:hypothetical protein